MLDIALKDEKGNDTDRFELIDQEGKPTVTLVGLALLELACDVALAVLLAKTVFRKK